MSGTQGNSAARLPSIRRPSFIKPSLSKTQASKLSPHKGSSALVTGVPTNSTSLLGKFANPCKLKPSKTLSQPCTLARNDHPAKSPLLPLQHLSAPNSPNLRSPDAKSPQVSGSVQIGSPSPHSMQRSVSHSLWDH